MMGVMQWAKAKARGVQPGAGRSCCQKMAAMAAMHDGALQLAQVPKTSFHQCLQLIPDSSATVSLTSPAPPPGTQLPWIRHLLTCST